MPCMGYGECVIFEYSTRAAGPSMEVSTCLDDDISCQAKCRCDDGSEERKDRSLAANMLFLFIDNKRSPS